jgi:hypothetical protein
MMEVYILLEYYGHSSDIISVYEDETECNKECSRLQEDDESCFTYDYDVYEIKTTKHPINTKWGV